MMAVDMAYNLINPVLIKFITRGFFPLLPLPNHEFTYHITILHVTIASVR